MEKKHAKNRKYVFMYPDIKKPTITEIEKGCAPRERLAGFYELNERGWNIGISDARWNGKLSRVRRKLKRYITLPSIGTFKDWLPADVIVIKDDFSLFLSLSVKILGKKLVYLDSMFALPKSRVRLILFKLNIKLADSVICFSSTQAGLWAKKFGVSESKFAVTKYGMDLDFYTEGSALKRNGDLNLIAIGRDVGRDFGILIDATRQKHLNVFVITLSYLLPRCVDKLGNVFVKERLPYGELFELYAKSSIAIVSLSGPLTYPSGIRAVMEGMLLGVPVIATRTPVLEEYFSDGDDIMFVEPGSVSDLSDKIDLLVNNEELASNISKKAKYKVETQFSHESYVADLVKFLSKV